MKKLMNEGKLYELVSNFHLYYIILLVVMASNGYIMLLYLYLIFLY